VLVLLDECVPESLRPQFVRHEAQTVRFRGWKGLSNGASIERAVDAGFAAIVTADKLLHPERKVRLAGLRVIVLPTNRLARLQAAGPAIEAAIESAAAGAVVELALA
jgi:hypothetical protein